jgi:hypothetical protein
MVRNSSRPIARVFRAAAAPGCRDELLRRFHSSSAALVNSKAGCLGYRILEPVPLPARRYRFPHAPVSRCERYARNAVLASTSPDRGAVSAHGALPGVGRSCGLAWKVASPGHPRPTASAYWFRWMPGSNPGMTNLGHLGGLPPTRGSAAHLPSEVFAVWQRGGFCR